MSYRVMALVAASVLMLSGSALAQKKDPTVDAVHLNTSRSNIYHKGGGAGVTTVKSGKSNTSDRMRGGGVGKGAARLNPQPEPPSRMNPIQPVHRNAQ
jgi:hypothetical protein